MLEKYKLKPNDLSPFFKQKIWELDDFSSEKYIKQIYDREEFRSRSMKKFDFLKDFNYFKPIRNLRR